MTLFEVVTKVDLGIEYLWPGKNVPGAWYIVFGDKDLPACEVVFCVARSMTRGHGLQRYRMNTPLCATMVIIGSLRCQALVRGVTRSIVFHQVSRSVAGRNQ